MYNRNLTIAAKRFKSLVRLAYLRGLCFWRGGRGGRRAEGRQADWSRWCHSGGGVRGGGGPSVGRRELVVGVVASRGDRMPSGDGKVGGGGGQRSPSSVHYSQPWLHTLSFTFTTTHEIYSSQ